MEELQKHSINVIQHLHHEGEEPPASAEVRGAWDACGGTMWPICERQGLPFNPVCLQPGFIPSPVRRSACWDGMVTKGGCRRLHVQGCNYEQHGTTIASVLVRPSNAPHPCAPCCPSGAQPL